MLVGIPDLFLIIDESGDIYDSQLENKIVDVPRIQTLLKNIRMTDSYLLTTHDDNKYYTLECFDHPLLVYKLEIQDEKIFIHTQYNLVFEAQPQKFSVDFEDQFCGLTTTGIPFRLTKGAMKRLFESCSEYDDDSFTMNDFTVKTPSYYLENSEIHNPNYWVNVYKTEGQPGWDLQAPAPAFIDMLPRLKMPKSRVLVLGCGEGHDAALFAEAGHVVTAVDFSAEGIKRGQEKYKHLSNLHFFQENIFNLPQEWNHSFDLVVEHTCFCAIPPNQRKNLVKIWRRMLHEEGQIMAVFFSMLKRAGPPYGSSEAELRALMIKEFQFLFWGRWRKSVTSRQGKELFILAKKK